MAAEDIAAVTALLDVAAATDGHRPLGEPQWLELLDGGRAGFAGLLATGGDNANDGDGARALIAYAQLSKGLHSWTLEYVVHPEHRAELEPMAEDLLGRALAIVAAEGGGEVHMWVPKPGAEHDRVAAAVGLEVGRELFQMRRPLPVDEEYELD